MSACKESYLSPDKDGYPRVSVGGKRYRASRYYYCKANGIPIEAIKGMVVRHKCDNCHCINPEHLELGTHADNMRDTVVRGKSRKGVKHPLAKLTEEQVRSIKADRRQQHVIAKEYGISQPLVSRIHGGLNWTHI